MGLAPSDVGKVPRKWRGAGQGSLLASTRHPHPPILHVLGLSRLQPIYSSRHHSTPAPILQMRNEAHPARSATCPWLPAAQSRAGSAAPGGAYPAPTPTCCWEVWEAGT